MAATGVPATKVRSTASGDHFEGALAAAIGFLDLAGHGALPAMHDDSGLAVDIANRINQIMRNLPPQVRPGDVLAALAAVSARLLTTLRPGDREPAYAYLMTSVRAQSGLPPVQ